MLQSPLDCKMSEFVHLHLHSEYSLLDGASDLEKLVKRAKALNMPAVAITDHGNIFGAVHFFNYAKAAEVKPILGCELYVCKKDDHRIDKMPPDGDTYNHLVVLAQNEEGYRNLVKIVSEASLRGFYYKPRISKAFLAEHCRGLIGLSACLKGEVAERLVEQKYAEAKKSAGFFREMFGEKNFYLEIQDQGLAAERRINPDFFRLEKETGIPLVATNDSHYLCEDDAHAHDVLLCVQTGKSLNDSARLRFEGTNFFVKSAEEMGRVFGEAPQVLTRTLEIADVPPQAGKDCESLSGIWGSPGLYRWIVILNTSPGRASRSALEQMRPLADAGRLKHSLAEYEARLAYEIGVIKQMKYSGIFPDRLGLHSLGAGTRYSGRAGPRFGGRARWLPTRCGSPTSTPCRQAAVRALPESRARVDARHRRRLLHEPPWPGDRLRTANTGAKMWLRSSPSARWRPKPPLRSGPGDGYAVSRSRSHRQNGPGYAQHPVGGCAQRVRAVAAGRRS